MSVLHELIARACHEPDARLTLGDALEAIGDHSSAAWWRTPLAAYGYGDGYGDGDGSGSGDGYGSGSGG